MKPFKFCKVNLENVMDRVPEGFKPILAYAKGDDIAIPIYDIPEESADFHNCDWESCGSLDHVVRFSIENKYTPASKEKAKPDINISP